MSLNPIVFTKQILDTFLRYQRKVFPFSDPRLAVQAEADSEHEWDMFLGEEHAVQAEYGNLEGAQDMAASPEHGKDPYQSNIQPGALFDPEEFRQDGQRRLF